jgi:hypothetical protein
MNQNWEMQYWKFMAAENFEEAIPLKNKNFPKSFYKYRNLSERTLETINENYIWLAEISSLNDPFECSIYADNDEFWREYYSSEKFEKTFQILTGQTISKKEIKKLITSQKPFEEYIQLCKTKKIPFGFSSEAQQKRIEKRWAKIVDEMNQNLRICSFSLIRNSLLLWSHYSDEHKGICIEYDFEDVDTIRTFIQPINYTNKVHKIGLLEEYSTMRMIASSLIKSTEWEYEKEWRLTIFRQKGNFPQKIAVPKPKAIYLGTRFKLNENSLKNKLLEICISRKIPIYQMIKSQQEFKLIEKLESIP